MVDDDSPQSPEDEVDAKLKEAAALEQEKRLRRLSLWRDIIADPANYSPQAVEDAGSVAELRQEIESPPEESTDTAMESISLRQKQMKLKHAKQVLKLRQKLASYAIWIVILQLVIANVYFGYYLYNNIQHIDTAVMVAWLSATVVEVIGILWVIARSLFPFNDKRRDESAEKRRR